MTWSKDIGLSAGPNTLTVTATDKRGFPTSQQVNISVRTPFTPTEIDQVFAPTTHLRELLDFAQRQIKIGATTAGPTAQVLASRFFQPFDRPILGASYEQAVAPVHQARIAVEMLRQQMHPAAPPETDQRFRTLVPYIG